MDLGNELTCSYNMRNKEEKKILLTHCIVRGGEYIPVTRETFTQSSQMRWSFKATYQVAELTTHIRTRIPFAHQWAMDTERFSYMIHTHPHKKKKDKGNGKGRLVSIHHLFSQLQRTRFTSKTIEVKRINFNLPFKKLYNRGCPNDDASPC